MSCIYPLVLMKKQIEIAIDLLDIEVKIKVKL